MRVGQISVRTRRCRQLSETWAATWSSSGGSVPAPGHPASPQPTSPLLGAAGDKTVAGGQQGAHPGAALPCPAVGPGRCRRCHGTGPAPCSPPQKKKPHSLVQGRALALVAREPREDVAVVARAGGGGRGGREADVWRPEAGRIRGTRDLGTTHAAPAKLLFLIPAPQGLESIPPGLFGPPNLPLTESLAPELTWRVAHGRRISSV